MLMTSSVLILFLVNLNYCSQSGLPSNYIGILNTSYNSNSTFGCGFGYQIGPDGPPTYECSSGSLLSGVFIHLSGSCVSTIKFLIFNIN